jgi:hypothetical protein
MANPILEQINMRTLLSLIFTLFLSDRCFAQLDSVSSKTDKQIMDKMQQLHDRNVDTIIYYHVDCNGFIKINLKDSCFAYDIKYLLWVDKGQSFIQKFNECFEYMPFKMNSSFFHLVRYNYRAIYKAVNGRSLFDHSCFSIFEIRFGIHTLTKKIDNYTLDYDYAKECHYCMQQYQQSKKSILNKLKVSIEKEVAIYDKNSSNKKGAQ